MTTTIGSTTTNPTTTNPSKALWEQGDFTRLAETMRTSGEEFIRRLDLSIGLDVLDLGCGDGTTAIPAAQAGADVRGIDIAANLVAAGRRRARALGLDRCTFEEGDASALTNVGDAGFDLLLTVFGAMFAPRPYDTAAEMVRVVACESETWTFDHAGSPESFVDLFRRYYGPTMNAFAAAAAEGRADDLQAELEALFRAQNISEKPGRTVIPATFLNVTVEC